ncbi:MAG: hypothetical protein EOO02_04640 [Chitinophagaceae bacterium]|nr:MAG: hypothetical protein EOO02_04640 [Chitinophagaceae bacterium]
MPSRGVLQFGGGAQTHHFNAVCNTLERSVRDLAATQELDNVQPDGETSTIEISSTGLIFVTLYVENMAGVKATQRVLLGEIFLNKPNQVNDYYDDPRLGAT